MEETVAVVTVEEIVAVQTGKICIQNSKAAFKPLFLYRILEGRNLSCAD